MESLVISKHEHYTDLYSVDGADDLDRFSISAYNYSLDEYDDLYGSYGDDMEDDLKAELERISQKLPNPASVLQDLNYNSMDTKPTRSSLPDKAKEAPINKIRSRSSSLPDLFSKVLYELDVPAIPSPVEYCTLPATNKVDIEGEMYINLNGKSEKRWCCIKKGQFIVYESFKVRKTILTLTLSHQTKVLPIRKPYSQSNEFRIVGYVNRRPMSITCFVEIAEWHKRWIEQFNFQMEPIQAKTPMKL
ncbi:hypothetical protein BC833DRAFT_654431, partial [Globomyces pollinis-pini]